MKLKTMQGIYHLSTVAFVTCLFWGCFYFDPRRSFYLLAAALFCLWIRVTYLIPAYLAEVERRQKLSPAYQLFSKVTGGGNR